MEFRETLIPSLGNVNRSMQPTSRCLVEFQKSSSGSPPPTWPCALILLGVIRCICVTSACDFGISVVYKALKGGLCINNQTVSGCCIRQATVPRTQRNVAEAPTTTQQSSRQSVESQSLFFGSKAAAVHAFNAWSLNAVVRTHLMIWESSWNSKTVSIKL